MSTQCKQLHIWYSHLVFDFDSIGIQDEGMSYNNEIKDNQSIKLEFRHYQTISEVVDAEAWTLHHSHQDLDLET